MKSNSTAFLIKIKLRHSLGRPSRSDFVQVKFSEPSEDYATKGESIEYKTPSISGRAMANDEGNWKSVEVFQTEKEAMDWINTKFGKEVVMAADKKTREK